ncbi:MAG: extracellular solute-binding protein [Lachnospiraceae bacterium]|nr:extracellular solute-binding protein [Lachnospiraceae bacterium]
MLKRFICAFLVLILAATCFYVAYTADDAGFAASRSEDEGISSGDIAGQGVTEDDGSLTLWYSDDALTEYLTSVALSFQQDQGIKVNIILKDGVQFLEAINAVSVKPATERDEPMPDLYITSHDNLLRAYLAGLASPITDPAGVVTDAMYPQTALDAVSCYDHYVGYPLYYETNFLLYNKTYMASIAQNKIEADADLAEGMEATQELLDNGAPKEESEEVKPEDSNGEDEGSRPEDGDDAETSDDEMSDPMGEEDAVADPEVLEKLATMIPASIEDIKTFANNYDAPEAVESVFKWDVSDIFYNYFFVGNYMDVGGPHGDNAAIFNIYNSQAVESLREYQEMNQFFSIDTKVDSYDKILQDFIDGKMVFTVATTDAIKRIHEAQKAGDFEFEYGVSTLPDISSLLKARGLSVTDAVAINGYSDKKPDANRFATYLVNYKAQDLYAKSGKVSCSKAVEYEDAEISKTMDEYERSVPLPKMVEAANYWVQLEIAFTKVWNGADPDETLKELSDTIGAQIEEIRANLPTQESFNAGAGTFVF